MKVTYEVERCVEYGDFLMVRIPYRGDGDGNDTVYQGPCSKNFDVLNRNPVFALFTTFLGWYDNIDGEIELIKDIKKIKRR